jgi:hypothetical protein
MEAANELDLINHVRQNPHDVQARLVLADMWCEREIAQGKLIQMAHQLSEKESSGSPELLELRLSCSELQQGIRQELKTKYDLDDVEFQHGYVYSIKINHPKFLALLTDSSNSDFSLVRRVSYHGKIGAFLERWLEEPGVTQISALDLGWCSIGELQMERLAQSPLFVGINELELSNNRLRNRGFRHLIQSPNLTQLGSLNIENNQISREGLLSWRDFKTAFQLKRLIFSENSIGPHGLEYLFDSPNVSSLKYLELANTKLRNAGPKWIAKSAYLKNLVELDISNNGISNLGIRELLDCTSLESLKSLDLSHNWMDDKGAETIAILELESQLLYGGRYTNLDGKLANREIATHRC